MKEYTNHSLANQTPTAFLMLLGMLFWLVAPRPAMAGAGAWAVTDLSSARLISAVDATGDLTRLPLAMELQLEPGWKAYWRAPGDAGLPPYFDWAGAKNLSKADIAWPLPERHTLLGFETFGYEGTIVFPIDVTPETPGEELDAKLHLRLMICKDVCVPQDLDMALSLPAGPAETAAQANLIERWRARVPGDGHTAGLAITALGKTMLDDTHPALTLTATADSGFDDELDVFVETAGGMSFTRPDVTFNADKTTAQITVALAGGLLAGETFEDDVLRNQPVTVTLVTGHGEDARAMEYTGTPGAVSPDTLTTDPTAAVPAKSMLAILLGAFIGGIILNLMPCVLPVLSLKLLYAVSHEDAPPARVRAGFLAAALGIIVSFLIIAAILAGMKSAGAAIGWGIQFQHPGFLVLMAVIVSLFACNMWGLFEIPLPRFIAERAGRSADHGEHEPTIAGHFATGMLATALATPCTAPFVGTAVGFALAGGTAKILGIFTAMGVGLALPYLLVAAFPGIAHKLPKPGKWMLHVKTILGIALIATAGWLLWVLTAQAGLNTALMSAALILAGMIAIAKRSGSPGGIILIWAFMLGAVALPVVISAPQAEKRIYEDFWTAFAPADIPGHVAQGKTVFVDITADWCLTCKANKKFTMSQPDILAAIQADNVVAMQGDWTKPDETIRAFLAEHKRYGIPFNIVYGPGAPDGIVLPELLSSDDVLNAIEKAGAGCGSEEIHAC